MGKIFVTGAAGFIGSHTCDQLLAAGHEVVGVDNFRTGKAANLASAKTRDRFRFVEADLTQPARLDSLVAEFRPDAIIHLAALVSVQESVQNPELNFKLNVELTQTVAEAARKHGVKRVVFASSAAVYGDVRELPIRENAEKRPISPYGAAKLASEAVLLGHAEAFGFTARCQRYFNVFGPRQDPHSPYSGVISIFCDRLRAGKSPTIFGDGEQTRDFISVYDVARANVLAATSPQIASGVANICTGKGTSLNRLASVLRSLIPNAPGVAYAAPKASDIRHSLGAAEAAQKEFGFTAQVALEDGLAAILST
ncbi:MAG: SDR family NAD(P)-dependent oxidoreductase [Nibricoccus sp.]